MKQNSETQPLKQTYTSWHKTNKRWIALILACLIEFGNSYSQDFPAVLQNQIEEQFNIGSIKYNLLFTVYSSPNIILPLIGGFIIDLIGIRKGLILFPLFLLLGQGVCMLGSMTNSYTLLIIGRVIYGLGGENNSVVQNTIVSKWFKGREIAFALGTCITLYRSGSILNSVITPKLYSVDKNITLGLFVSLIFLLSCWFCSCLLAYIDWKSDSRDEAYKLILIEEQQVQGEQVEEGEEEKISLRDIISFKVHFWLVVTILMLCYTNLFGFQWNNIEMFKTMFSLNDDQAQLQYQIPYFMGALLTPFSGIFVDKIGQRPLILIISNFLLTSVNLWYLLIPICDSECLLIPMIGQIFFGFFCIFMASAIWPTLPLCVLPHTVGTAFGIASTMQNLGLAIGPILVGYITEPPTVTAYRYMMVFFLSISVVALVLSFFLKLYDKVKLNSILSKKTAQTNKIEDTPTNQSD